jgi:hypothetical protein
LSESVELFEEGVVLFRAEDRSLDNSCAVSYEEETDLSAGTLVENPTSDFNFLIFEVGNVFYISPVHVLRIIKNRKVKVNSYYSLTGCGLYDKCKLFADKSREILPRAMISWVKEPLARSGKITLEIKSRL